jgi:hypothetical protein
MAYLIYRLNTLPDDEINEIRELLNENTISFYETHRSPLGWGIAGFWTPYEIHLKNATQLIQTYQIQRSQKAFSFQEKSKKEGLQLSRWHYFLTSPIKHLFLFSFILFFIFSILYPFFK